MAVPRNRLSNSRKNTKRAHHASKPKNIFACPNCGHLKLSHVVCTGCGSYADRVVFEQKAT